MTNFETFYYYFGFLAFYTGLVILIHDSWDFRKRKQRQLRRFLIAKKQKHFKVWCVVLKPKNYKNDVEYLYLTKFFAKKAVNKINNFARIQHPMRSGNACHGFMFKKDNTKQ